MPPPDTSSNTPLAPSVEKAYYRKCIELKRRLNEVEAANDEAKVKRIRLDRGILKMRLERAYLLDELKKRMEYNVDESDGSGEENMATPPADRPHRDKRRRHNPPPQGGPSTHAHQPPPTGIPRQPSDPQYGQPAALPSQPYGAPGGQYVQPGPPIQHPPPPPSGSYNQSSPYAPPPPPRPPIGPPSYDRRPLFDPYGREMPGSADGNQVPPAVSRQAGATGEALTAGPTVKEGANGERRVGPSDD